MCICIYIYVYLEEHTDVEWPRVFRISCGFPVFDRTEREAAILGNIQKEELLNLFEKLGSNPGNSAKRSCLLLVILFSCCIALPVA